MNITYYSGWKDKRHRDLYYFTLLIINNYLS